MAIFPFSVDSVRIGTANITASGGNIVLPAGTQVGNQPVATVVEVSTGGGPKITNLQITDNAWTVLDDTAVDTAGGYVLITGTNFVSGALVYFNQTAANSVAFVGTTTLRVTVPALTAGTYIVYVINPDGGTAIRVPGLTASANPAWQTASALPDQYDGVAITLNLVATDATSYTITSGSLPPGLSLNANTGVISGTVSGVSVDTTYTFTVRATDAQLQDSPRTFTVTITVSDPYFRLTTLLLSGSALSANTVVRDSSTNNFNLTVFGDARASNFTPYLSAYSYYFPSSAYITSNSLGNSLGTGDFCMEYWVWMGSYANNYVGHLVINTSSTQILYLQTSGNGLRFLDFNGGSNFVIGGGTLVNGRWHHLVGTRQNGTMRGFIDGNLVVTQASMTFNYGTVGTVQVGSSYDSYLIGARVTVGSVPVEYQTSSTTLNTTIFTVPTGNPSATANTIVLTGQCNRFVNQVGNIAFPTITGSPRVTTFNPFNITNTGVNGSMYFDGTTDSVRLPSNAISALPGDFTLEFWIYLISTAGNPVIYLVNATAALIIYVVSSKVVVRSYGTADLLTSVDNIQINTWTHVAVARSGSALSLWLNGSRASGGTITYSTAFPQGEIRIATNESDAQSTNGYIADLRLIKGTAQYNPSNTTITVPTAPLTAVANTQLLTLQYDQPHNNHTFLDSSSNQHLITRSGNASQGTFSPFSQTGWSNYFDGSGDYLSISNNTGFDLSSSDFTVEAWVYRTGDSGAYTEWIIGKRSISSGDGYQWSWSLGIGSSNYASFGNYNGAVTGTTAINFNTWYHISVTRISGAYKLYVNGLLEGTNAGFAIPEVNVSLTIGNYPVDNPTFTGYISNIRVIKGNGLYTANFTPATNTLTAVANTSLLTCHANRFMDASTNNFTIAKNGDARVVAFSPFAATAVYSPITHGASVYFDGSGDFLTFPDHPALELGNRDFTVECWVYRLSTDSHHGILSKWSSPSYPFMLWIKATNVVGISINNSLDVSTTATISTGTWNHIAVTRNANVFTIWLNGVSAATATSSITMTDTSQQWSLGRNEDTNTYHFNGYISGFRVVAGIAVYTSAFTPPTAPPTSTANTQLLLNFTDSAILDNTGRNAVETVADAKSSSVVTKFNGGSMYFDGTGDAINIRSSDLLTFGTGDWTVEFWVYHTSVSGQQTYLGDTGGATSGPYIYKDSSHKVGLYYSSQILTGTTTIAINTWYFIVLSRASGTVRLFTNGIQETSASDTTNLTVAIQWVGGDTFPSGYLSGYMNDIRVTKGYARYTANFTAPTAPARLK